jgi:hypothetical protein
MTTAVFDMDFIKYEAGYVAEDRSILVTEKKSGDQYTFKNRTEFWGASRKHNGGWLFDKNKGRLSPLTEDDFTIEDVQTPKGMRVAKNVVQSRIEGILHKLGTTSYYGYIGQGDSFRVERSTILKYKGTRDGTVRPLLIDEITSYMLRTFPIEVVRDIEADDQVTIDCYHNKDQVLVGVDKDYCGCEVNLFNPDKMDVPRLIKGVGRLWIDDKKEVRGDGFKWLCHQVLSGDSSDNYHANSACPETRWGYKSSYNLLGPAKTYQECLEAVITGYKQLYPEPKKVIGWGGDELEVDWLYVASENWDLARMLRWEGDVLTFTDVIDKMKISY